MTRSNPTHQIHLSPLAVVLIIILVGVWALTYGEKGLLDVALLFVGYKLFKIGEAHYERGK